MIILYLKNYIYFKNFLYLIYMLRYKLDYYTVEQGIEPTVKIQYKCLICNNYLKDWDDTWDDAKKAEVKAEAEAHHNYHMIMHNQCCIYKQCKTLCSLEISSHWHSILQPASSLFQPSTWVPVTSFRQFLSPPLQACIN